MTRTRDYLAEMNALIDALLDEQADLLPAPAAEKLIIRLRETDPRLLTGWLTDHAPALLTQYIRDRNRWRRRVPPRTESRRRFAQDMAAGAFSAYRLRFLIADGSQRHLRDMTIDDLRWLADNYGRRASWHTARQRFFAALADRVAAAGVATVSQAVSDDELTTEYEQAFSEE